MTNKYIGLSFIGLSLFISACTTNIFSSHSDTVNLNNIHKHVKTLASDEFAGRGPLTIGEELTINYLAEEYKKLGLAGGVNGEFFQPVPMAKLTPDPAMVLKIGNLEFTAGKDFTARTEQISEKIALVESEIVFVGYGINAPEYQWNDYQDIDVTGKTVVILVNDPGFATQNDSLFTGNAMTYYGRWTYKYEEAARQGAKAVLIIHETAPAAYPWSVVESSNTGSKYTLIDEFNNSSKLPIMGWLHYDATEKLMSAAGLNYQALKEQALMIDFKAIPLNLTANLELNSTIEHAESNNVVALLEGTTRADEYIIVSAHWDHFGTKQTPTGPKIYNGAIDNATGTAGTIEIARILKEQHKIKPFERSILFVNFTAEETGLIGSELFARGDIIPTKQMVGLLNIDGMNALDGVDYILQYGKNMSEMEDYLAEAAAKQQRQVKLDPRPQNGLFFRSDHFSFAKQGVPSLLFMSLGDTDPDYIAHKYHKEEDDYSSDWSLGGVEQDISLIVDIVSELATNNDWPKWKENSDFKKRRLQDKQ
ncbi:M28 family metallopeptidase [Colwellia sp. 4_MG-2023]|jgi:Zn-dependent M28 family amino/carboxypeptidase|uniref:M28 family metallopeptidase n=1 Tax=unclassified Colwellia TaxID=196834 RepID=UPI0026E12E11|nr:MULTISPECIES: M28 family metallopeptidase [unclassified Colwellia]MDO6508637.1 M28 family metallopeptidase [Colwellia sp. 5_MG-2023]MDO6557291.1 M28 family metallopeptidase [Colwellia sp. 4_MG-2023]